MPPPRIMQESQSSYDKKSKRRSIRDVCLGKIISTDMNSTRQTRRPSNKSLSSMNSDSTRSIQSLESLEAMERVLKVTPLDLSEKQMSQRQPCTVDFSTVEIKEYSIILGDNPGASYPISLDWNHSESYTMSVNEHNVQATTARRLDAQSRIDRLTTMGYRKKDLRTMERDRKMSLVQEWKDSEDSGDEIMPPPRAIRID